MELKHDGHPDEMTFDARDIYDYCQKSGFEAIPLQPDAIFVLRDLQESKCAGLHKDPFDRMLLCQAAATHMRLVTHDKKIAEYDKSLVALV